MTRVLLILTITLSLTGLALPLALLADDEVSDGATQQNSVPESGSQDGTDPADADELEGLLQSIIEAVSELVGAYGNRTEEPACNVHPPGYRPPVSDEVPEGDDGGWTEAE
jgi:hypothetical protein